MFEFTVKVTKDNSAALQRALDELTTTDVLVGYPMNETPPRKDEEIRNAEVAYLNEKGSPARSIPARPFIVPGIESVSDEVVKHLTSAAEAAIEGRPEAVQRGYEAAGLRAVAGIKNFITAGLQPPQAQAKVTTGPLLGTRQSGTMLRAAPGWPSSSFSPAERRKA